MTPCRHTVHAEDSASCMDPSVKLKMTIHVCVFTEETIVIACNLVLI